MKIAGGKNMATSGRLEIACELPVEKYGGLSVIPTH